LFGLNVQPRVISPHQHAINNVAVLAPHTNCSPNMLCQLPQVLDRSLSPWRRHIDRPKAAGEFVILQPLIKCAADRSTVFMRDTSWSVQHNIQHELTGLTTNYDVDENDPDLGTYVLDHRPDPIRKGLLHTTPQKSSSITRNEKWAREPTLSTESKYKQLFHRDVPCGR